MVNIETGAIVDIIKSREFQDVSNWLSEYPNLKFVSRDGSMTYAAAIAKAHPNACQINDRFHIIKNICEAATKYFQKIFKGRIEIPITSKQSEINKFILEKPSVSQRYIIAQKMHSQGETLTEISSVLRMSIATVKKYVNTKEEDIPKDIPTCREIEHKNAIKKVKAKVDLVKSLSDKGYSLYKISKETGFTRQIVKEYLSPSFSPIHGQYGTRRSGVLAPYREEVIQLLSDGFTYERVVQIIRKKGYTGSVAALRLFISKERRIEKSIHNNDVSIKTEFVQKKWLKQLLYKPLESVPCITKEQLNAVIDKYPTIQDVYVAISDFKKIMFSKKLDGLLNWISNTEKLGIEELNSFINGIQQDIEAVKNAILLEYNNGLAEGSVNKLKLVKRIMYGRCNFDTLRNKMLMLEYIKYN